MEFDTPVGYQEPKRFIKKSQEDEDVESNENLQNHYDTSFIAFSGEGNRLDGKKKKCDKTESATATRVSLVPLRIDFSIQKYENNSIHFLNFCSDLHSWNTRL